jgi:hypothetical protein
MYVQFSPFFLRFFFPKNVEGVSGGTRTKERCYYYRFPFLNITKHKEKRKNEKMNIFSSFYPSAIFQETIEIKKSVEPILCHT